MKTFRAAVLDLDGVITTTATQHSRSWKLMFDAYNERRKMAGKESFAPFSESIDYPRYIDGIPRYDGVKAFLSARGIDLPYGEQTDESGKETICGLGNLKNEMYLKMIGEEGVGTFDKNIQQVRNWRKMGLKTAIISSSKNCRMILESTGLLHLFDVRVDGVVSEERAIKGKPAPDIFLEAARELQVKPSEALIVEDSQAGIQAGVKGHFGLVVGIGEDDAGRQLSEKGAHIVVKNLGELDISVKERQPKKISELKDAMKNIPAFRERFTSTRPFIFLDFDGTLSPIVEKHEDAAMDEEMKTVVHQLAGRYDIAVVSGRGMADVRQRVGLENIFYAGSHGFEMSGPRGFFKELEEAKNILPLLDELGPRLKQELKDISGVRLERKKFTLAVHYRQVASNQEEKMMKIVDAVLENYKDLKKGRGKKVLELRPYLDWDKGKAVEMLIKELAGTDKTVLTVYIGDDLTDEDAFRVIGDGITILVGDHGEASFADYALKDVEAVKLFLKQL